MHETPKVSIDNIQICLQEHIFLLLIFPSNMKQPCLNCQGFCTLPGAPGTPLAGPKKGVCFGVTSYLSWGSPCSGDVSQPHTWKPGCSARWLLNCQNPLSVLGKICQNQNVSVNHLGLMLCYFPMKKCFVRKFLLNSTIQKQLEYKKFSFFVPLLFLFFTDILFLKLEMN